MEGSRGKQSSSRPALSFFSKCCDGWAIVVWLSLFFSGVLIGTITSGSTALHPQLPVRLAPRASQSLRTGDKHLIAMSRLNNMLLTQKLDTQGCDPQDFGVGWAKHALCAKKAPTTTPCHFYSFGISTDYSFDVELARRWNCTGFAADPTVVHNSTLYPGVTFHNVAANSPWLATQTNSNWIKTSVPALRMWLKHDRIAVLKMDCEGCEYSLAQDVLDEDPTFFNRVDQFAMEIHWSRFWLKSSAELNAIALLFLLLEEAGLKLMHADIAPCGEETATGLLPELQEYMSVVFAPRPNLHCHNYLFARS